MGRIGIIRGSEFSVMVMAVEADSAGSWELSKGRLPSELEIDVVIWGLEVTECLSEEERELAENDSIAAEGI